LDPGITLNRFGWDEDAAEGMSWRTPEGPIIPWDEEEAEEDVGDDR
jgi:hypothetical protein